MRKLRKGINIILIASGCCLLIFFISWAIRSLSVESRPKEIVTANFDVFYSGILKSEAEIISQTLESNYDRIRTDLQDPKHNKISVYIHPTQSEFNQATGLVNSKANGTSRGPWAFHLKYETWFNSIFPQAMEKVALHEFTHCVQLNILINEEAKLKRTANDAQFDKDFETKFTKYPQWLWEAICDYEAKMVNCLSVKYGMKNNPSLQELNNSNRIYNVGYTIIEFFVAQYGKEKLAEFIKSYGNFEQTLGISEKEFETGWYRFVDAKY